MQPTQSKTSSTFWDGPQAAEVPTGFSKERVLIGAVYGLLLGCLYALIGGTIDALLVRDVPMRVDWPAVWASVMGTGVGAAALGAIVAWPHDFWRGVIVGALALTAWSMLRSFVLLQAAALTFLPLFLPFAVMSVPIAFMLRWMTHRHEQNREKHGQQRLKAQAWLLAIIALVGVFAGSWSQMPVSSQEAVRQVHRIVQRTLADSSASLPRAFDAVPDIRAHAGVPYAFSQRPSAASPTAVDVQVTFEDGYVITCMVETSTSVVTCVEGSNSVFGPFQFDPNDQR